MLEVQDIFERYSEEYCNSHKLSLVQRKALNAILNCRTAKLGGHVDTCPKCGDAHISYNSCRNRHCPKCQTFAKERWIDARKADLLSVGYFHVVFTLPSELYSVVYGNQEMLYNLMFRCVWDTIRELAADKKYLGASIGITSVLHTWGQNLSFHPHIHCIVPAGGLTPMYQWVDSKLIIPNLDPTIFNSCYVKEWVVYCKPPFKTAGCVVEYLGRYTHRVAISNNRLLKLEDGQVTFKWRDYKDASRTKEMTISADEFLRRFLMHILPHGFMKIRHYGFLSSRAKQTKLPICKKLTQTSLVPKEKLSTDKLLFKLLGRNPLCCRVCGYSGLCRTGLAPPVA